MKTQDILRSDYNGPNHPASFGTVDKLYSAAKKLNDDITREQTENWLKKQITYTLHNQARRRFRRNQIVVTSVNEQWECDIADKREFSKENEGFNYILTVVDCFSKFAFAEPLKFKSANGVSDAFQAIFKTSVPFKIRSDRGKEFENNIVRKLFRDYNIQFFTSRDKEIKCAIVERFNRTLKAKMFKFFTANGKRRYIEDLQKLVNSYNTVHASTNMKPSEVSDKNAKIVFKNLFGFLSVREMLKNSLCKSKLKIGDSVRLRYDIKPFDKGYYPNWTDEIFTIHNINNSKRRPTFCLKSDNNTILNRIFYEEDLQEVIVDLYRVEKIIKRRREGNQLQYFVKW